MIAVSVTDAGGAETVPKVTYADEDAVRGRGLVMVSMLAHNVAIRADSHGHTITAELVATRSGGHRW